jgi:hypothetical protein
MRSGRAEAALLQALFLTGCGYHWAHPAPAVPDDGQVHIEGVSAWNADGGFTQAAVCAVDGRELDRCETELALPVGRHALRLRLWGVHHFIPTSLDVICEFDRPGYVPLGGFVTGYGMKPHIPGCRERG